MHQETKKFLWFGFLWYSLYWGGLEQNLQYLQGMPGIHEEYTGT